MNREVLALLQTQVRCLEKFRDAATAFRNAVEAGDWSRLQPFEKRREAILRVYRMYDRKLSELAPLIGEGDRTEEFVSGVKRALRSRDRLLALIQKIDSRIFCLIEEEQTRVAKGIDRSRRGGKSVRKFHSNWADRTGSGLDTKL